MVQLKVEEFHLGYVSKRNSYELALSIADKLKETLCVTKNVPYDTLVENIRLALNKNSTYLNQE